MSISFPPDGRDYNLFLWKSVSIPYSWHLPSGSAIVKYFVTTDNVNGQKGHLPHATVGYRCLNDNAYAVQ